MRRAFGRGHGSPAWTPQRVVVDAHVAVKAPEIAKTAQRAGVPFLVDPQTHFLQGRQDPGFAWTHLPFASAEPQAPADLRSRAARERLVEECLDYQLATGATVLIPPYVHIERHDSAWVDVQAALWRATRRYLDREGVALDVLAVLAVGWRLLHPIQGQAALLPVTGALRDLAPAELGVAASKAHMGARPQDRLVELLALVRRLGQQWPVLMWQQGLLGEACVVAGAAGYETGIGWRESCDLQTAMASHRYVPGPESHPGARPVYVDALKRSVPKRSLVQLRGRRGLWSRLLCPDPDCCPPAGEGLLEDARRHAITRRAQSLAALSQIQDVQWQWSHLAHQTSHGLDIARRINAAAADDPLIARVDTNPLQAIHAVADHHRTQRRLRASA